MPTLRDWHSRLDIHYRTLRESRAAGGGHPIFALEHGLDASDRAALGATVQDVIRSESPSRVFYLPWVVYAAELGYLFAGEEYWQTFEDQTPGWVERGNRSWLRDAFRRFSKWYGGAQPQGAWAQHFSIICWPITHAILPRDLQRQLAQVLFDLRWVLRIEHLNQPETLGQLIHSRAATRSSRFTAFAEDAPLVGQIAAALLLKDSSKTSHLIETAALERIADDLDRERLARTWLAEARQRANQVRLRGVVSPVRATYGRGTSEAGITSGRNPFDGRGAADRSPGVQYQRSTLGIDPRLVLRPEGDGVWSVELEIPELQHLLESAEWGEVLSQSRCRVAGGLRRLLAPGRLLYGTQRVGLERWPKNDDVLLDFEGAPASISAALKTTALLPPGPIWLFKLMTDGRAYHIRSNVARPGAEYFVVSTHQLEYDRVLSKAEVRCAGVYGGRISVPEHVPPSVDGMLNALGLARASSIWIFPACLPPLFWDGEGHVEWLSTDTPVVAIERQAVGEAVELSLSNVDVPGIRIAEDSPNPAYVELPPLATGTHTMTVRATGPGVRTADAALEITIRAPRPWTGTLGEQHAVQAVVSPAEPTLEDLLAGRFRMEVRGPSGLPVDSTATLWSYRRQIEIYRKTLPMARLPFDAAAWYRAFVRDFLDAKPVQDGLERGWAIEVQFAFGSVAAQQIRFVRNLSPLRWSVRSSSRSPLVRLVDDTGIEGEAEVTIRSFSEPGVAVPLPLSTPTGSLALPECGGLLAAVHGEHRATAILAPRNVRDMRALQVRPSLPHYRRAADGIAALVSLAGIWADATPHGSQMARLRQCEVLRSVHTCLVRHLCGTRWEVAEKQFLADLQQSPHTLSLELTPDPGERQCLREPLERAAKEFPALNREARAEQLQAIFSRLRKHRDLDVAEAALALEVMSVPERVRRQSEARWRALLDCELLMRAARFLVVVTHRNAADRDIMAIPLYAGWN